MTFEEFSLLIQYKDREKDYYNHYESHIALFRLLAQYVNNRSLLNIKFTENAGHKCIYTLSPASEVNGNMMGFLVRVNDTIVAGSDRQLYRCRVEAKDKNVRSVSVWFEPEVSALLR